MSVHAYKTDIYIHVACYIYLPAGRSGSCISVLEMHKMYGCICT